MSYSPQIPGLDKGGGAASSVPASGITGTTLPAAIVNSSLTTVGTLTGGATGAGFTVALGTSTFTGTLGAAYGGTGASNGGSLAFNGAVSFTGATVTISNSGTLDLGGFAATIPATGTVAMLSTANTFTAAQLINNSLGGLTSITGGANNLTITSGIGNSRTLTLRTTTSGGAATDAIVISAAQDATFTRDIIGGRNTGASASGLLFWSGSSQIASPSDGIIRFQNNAATGFTRFQFGVTTSSGPAFGISGTTITAQLADGTSGGAFVASGTLAVTGASTLGSGTSIKNIRHGITGAMTGGAVTVTDTGATANTRYTCSPHTLGTVTVAQSAYASSRSAGASFVLTSSTITDTSTWDWVATEP